MYTHLYKKVITAICLCFVLLLSAQAFAGPILAPTSTWSAAQTGRTWMDIGGVWNGTTEVTATGDHVTFVLNNTQLVGATQNAYDIKPSVLLPNSFVYVPNTASISTTGTGCTTLTPTVTAAVQSGRNLNFTITPSGYDLYAQCQMTLKYDMKVDITGVSGTSQVFNQWQYAATQGGVLNVNPYADPFNVLVQAGAVVLAKTPASQTGTLNATANWSVGITNTGLGALFDVSVDEYAIKSSAGVSLALTAITSTPPTGSTLTTTPRLVAPKGVINYLAPGKKFSTAVNATITSCKNIDNTVYSTDRTGQTNTSATAHIVLTQKLPNISVTVNPYSLAYNAVTPMSVTIKNTGTGVATGFTLQTNLVAQGITVSAVVGGWTYNATTGVFTYGAGTVAAGANVTLNFSVAATNMCIVTGAANISWTATYSNECAAAYNTPSVSSVLNAPAAMPSLILSNDSYGTGTITPVVDRFAVGTTARFLVGFSAKNTNLINGTSFIVTNTLPAGISAVTVTPSVGTSFTCTGAAGACTAGSNILWTVPNPLPVTTPQLTIDYTTPTGTCSGGIAITNSAVVNATTVKTCNLTVNASSSPLITNNLAGAGVTQSFNVGNPIAGTSFETGSPTVSTVPTRAATGEGEFIPFTASYTFGTGAGTWAGSTYVDDFAGSGATLVPNTLTLTVGGVAQVVPNANVTCTTGTLLGNNCSGKLAIDLGFITANAGNVANQSLTFTYKTTIPDAALAGVSTKKLTQLATLTVAAGATGGCTTGLNQVYTLGAFVPVAKAEATIALSMPATIDVCEPATGTMTVSNASEEFARNVMASFPTGAGTSYNFPTQVAPILAGLFTTTNIAYTAVAVGGPTFVLTPKLSTNGTITFVLQLKRGSNKTPVAAQVRVDYDDYQTSTTTVRDFYATGSFTPTIVRKGLLVISMTPQQYTVIGQNVSWKIYVTNVGDGTSFGATLYNTLPTGMTLDSAATNTSNVAESCSTILNAGLTCNNVAVTAQQVSWTLGDIPAGSTRTIVLNATVGGGICSIANGSNDVYAQWGCGGVALGPGHVLEPNFTFPAGQMEVVHDTVNTFAPLCGVGKDVIIVRNTGTPDILNASAQEVLNPTITGLAFVAGTVEVSTDGGTTWTASVNPTGAGTTASPYKWTKVEIPALADLYSATGGGVNEVRIRFGITVGEKASNAPTITASGAGTISCGNPVSSPGTPYVIPVRKPNIKVVKTGLNTTANFGGAFNATVYGGSGDVIDWYVTVQNTGSVDAYNVRFQDVFAGSGATTMTVLSQPAGSTLTTITNNTVVSFSDLLANTTQAYHFKETLGNFCTGFGSDNKANLTWGCINKGAAVASNLPSTNPGVTAATPVTGKAKLIMTPGFGYFATNPNAQTITPQAAGRTQVVVAFDNGGGTASTLSLSSIAFPAGMMLDPYAAITVTGTAVGTGCVLPKICLDGTATATGLATSPTFTLGGTGMRNGTGAALKFFLVPTLTDNFYAKAYPALAVAEPNAANNQLDPLASNYGGNLSLSLSSPSTCANAQTNANTKLVNPLTPDLDMTVNPAYAIVSDGYTMSFDFNFKNVGEAASTADYMQFTLPIVKTGLTINSVTVISSGTTGWTGLVCSQVAGIWTCGDPSLWSGNLLGYDTNGINAGNMTVRVNVTAHDNGFPMSLVGDVKGQFFSQSQNGKGAPLNPKVFLGAYSHDRAAPRILGLNFKKTLVKTSETFTADPYTAIGEELTYDLYARLFGADTTLAPAGGAFQNLIFRDTLPTGLGLVSLAAQPNNTLTPTISGAATPAASNPLKAGIINMNIASYSAVSAVFDYYATVRTLNTTANIDGTNLLNSFGGSLNYQGQTFRSNNATDGFTGGTALASLHAEYTAVVHRPTVTIAKTVRNVTGLGIFAATATGSAGDTYEYKVVLTNTSTTTPAYDLKVVDNLPTTLVLIDGATDTIDNDGDGLIDGADASEGKFTVVAAPTGGGSIVFNDAYAAIATVGSNFAKLNPGSTISLLYRAVGNPSKVGAAATVVNTATATYTTLPGPTGTAMSAVALRASGLVDGEGSTDVYSQATISMTSRVSGTVYLDANKDSLQNGSEAGTGLTLYVKLIDNAGVAIAVQAVDPTTGGFAFPTVAAGTYHMIVDTNTTLIDVTATIPTSWIGTQTPNQIRANFTLAAIGSKINEDFGMYQSKATLFNGRVFEDNGITGGIAHDAIQNGGEKGIPKVKVELTDCSTNVYATAYTNGSGDFTLALLDSLGVLDGSALCIQETNPSAYLSTGGKVGTLGGTYTIATDKMSFTLNKAGSPFSGVLFGDIAPNTFLTDNVGTAMPGAVKFYPHQFKAGTAGTVVFSSGAVGNPANLGWSNVLYQDTNCNQTLDAGEQQLTPTTALTLAADAYTCILDKQFVPSNMAYDSRNLVTVTATFTYVPTNANLPVKTYTRTDTTIVGQEGLILHKAVNLPVAKPGQVITYTITYTNPTQGVLNNIVIHDATPAYTTFTSASCGTKGTGITACAAGTTPTAGQAGSIAWSLTGSLQPNGSGTVQYKVTVN
ncbi:MAG: DUF11 domain-containing protein [Mariprofundaceae bacterium]|nr:DUF11 domain-containing protein [Mariprofundaceae bacterium]